LKWNLKSELDIQNHLSQMKQGVLMDEESDEELEDPDDLMESCVQSTSSSEDEDNTKETKVTFQARRAGDSSNVFDFTGPSNDISRSTAPHINAESCPISVLILFFRQVFQIMIDETNHNFHQYMASKDTGSTSAQPADIMIEEMYAHFMLVIHMGHGQCGSLKDYWSREGQY
jgi:hypothetical protein